MDENIKISVIGLGYVGLPLAIELAKKYDVIGFDTNEEKLNLYKNYNDVTDEVGADALKKTTMKFTHVKEELRECNFHIVAVPTPINSDKTPNLAPIIGATQTIGENLKKGSIVVFESTVYPGTTEEICVPILEKTSGLVFGVDFKVGYSPERINPGDKVNTLTNIPKVVSGSDKASLKSIASVYSSIIKAGIYEAESIKVAEAAKVIENSQRDINIAFMNELSIVFGKMGINTSDVLNAASTKWNFLNFTPGLVGGHCIGVDPYYFTYKAEQLGYHSQIISAGRKINDEMGKYVAESIIKNLVKNGEMNNSPKVGILGVTFKENCADSRNTKVIDIVEELQEYGVGVYVHDPIANANEVKREYDIELVSKDELKDLDTVVIAVAHNIFKNTYSIDILKKMMKSSASTIFDLKSILDKEAIEENNLRIWSL